MNTVVRHNGLRICTRCHLFCTESGQPDPAYYSPEWIDKFNSSTEEKCKHTIKRLMTVEELLAKMDARYKQLVDDLDKEYLRFGRAEFAGNNTYVEKDAIRAIIKERDGLWELIVGVKNWSRK